MATTKIFVLHIRQIINFSAVMILVLAIIFMSIFLKHNKKLNPLDIKKVLDIQNGANNGVATVLQIFIPSGISFALLKI